MGGVEAKQNDKHSTCARKNTKKYEGWLWFPHFSAQEVYTAAAIINTPAAYSYNLRSDDVNLLCLLSINSSAQIR